MNGIAFFLLSLASSYEDMRFEHMHKQVYDTSCGISSTSTLLDKYWNIPVTEGELFGEMLPENSGTQGDDYTINFVAIGEALTRRGVETRYFKMDWGELSSALENGFSPILVNYDHPLPHFALLLHIEGDYAFVADPAEGLEIVSRSFFEQRYSGNALVTASRTQNKNTARIQKAVEETQERHGRLNRLARLQR